MYVLSLLLIIVVFILPILIKNRIKTKYSNTAFPDIDNKNLLARFPGEINSKIVHTFSKLDYSDNNKPKINDSLSLEV